MSGIKRRTVLAGGAAGIAAATLPACNSDKDTGEPLPPGIDHVIVVMMENRSFDHYLGGLKLEAGMDVDGLDGTETNPNLAGDDVPVFHLSENCQYDPPHGWNSSHDQFADGENSGFVLKHEGNVGQPQGEWVMGYHNDEEVPVHWALAQHFCVPDAYFCSVMGPTWPNRLFGHSASSNGAQNNSISNAPFPQKTIYQALDEAGVDWRYFYTDVPFLGLFDGAWDPDRVSVFEDFLDRVGSGDLPSFSWVDPGFSFNDDHPPHHPGLGQIFLALVYESLARSPIWERTLLVITYDEHGGFYDHVPPPTVGDDLAAEGFDRLGFRVPTLVVGPWVKQGAVSTVFDHASVLKYVCERFDLPLWNERLLSTNSLGECIDTDRMESGEALQPIVLPAFDVPEEEVTDACQYGRNRFSTSQPELLYWVERNMPETSRQEQVPEIHERLLARARELGVLG
ncbi:MAG TPA: alkaline phosphatase family protein [Myxococcota bacterium]|nr:alkaline phosphatase family protein [Myxococcota bacterium]